MPTGLIFPSILTELKASSLDQFRTLTETYVSQPNLTRFAAGFADGFDAAILALQSLNVIEVVDTTPLERAVAAAHEAVVRRSEA